MGNLRLRIVPCHHLRIHPCSLQLRGNHDKLTGQANPTNEPAERYRRRSICKLQRRCFLLEGRCMGPLPYRGCVGLPHLYNAMPECQPSRSHRCKLAGSVGTLMIFVKNQINFIRRWGWGEWVSYRKLHREEMQTCKLRYTKERRELLW